MTKKIAAALLLVLFVSLIAITANGWNDGAEEMRALDGQWEFYWHKLLEPDDFRTEEYAPAYLTVPESVHEMMRPFRPDHANESIHTNESIKVALGEIETKMDGREAYVQADRLRIMQVVHNFVSNARKYNHAAEKGVVLHCGIRSSNTDKAGYEAIFEFRDNGDGIDPADLPHIFELFYRKADGYVDGSGLGLAIVKSIIEQHGGIVGARNKKEAGSVFYFTLPASLEGQSPRSGF